MTEFSLYLSTHLCASMHMSSKQSAHALTSLTFPLFILLSFIYPHFLSIYLFFYILFYLPLYLLIYISILHYTCLSVFICLSIYLYIYPYSASILYVYISASLPTSLSIHLLSASLFIYLFIHSSVVDMR